MEDAFEVNGHACFNIELSSQFSLLRSSISQSRVHSRTLSNKSVNDGTDVYESNNGNTPVIYIMHSRRSGLCQRSREKETIIFVSDIIVLDRHETTCKGEEFGAKLCSCGKAKSNNLFVLYYVSRSKKNASIWCLKSLVIANRNAHKLQKLFDDISEAFLHVLRHSRRPKRLFVIVNPYGGAGKGLRIWNRKARPLLSLADIEMKVTMTERAGHAFDLCYNLDWKLFDGIVAVGGDGILNECIHAFAARKEEGQFDKCPIPFGLIPAGSTNCINEVATGVVDVETCCLQMMSGQQLGLDVIFLRDLHSDQLVRVSFCSVAYGFFGDLLIRSEKLRCMGPIRYIIAGALSFIHLRAYRVETDIAIADVDHWDLLDVRNKCVAQPNQPNRNTCPICEQARLSSTPVPVKRHTNIRAQVAYLQVVANSCACKQSKLGISPNAHLGDGTMDVVFACKTRCSHLNAIRILSIHSSKADRFSPDFIRPYRAATMSIKVLPLNPSSSTVKKPEDQKKSLLRRKTSAVFSSSSTRKKKRDKLQSAISARSPGAGPLECPPSPVMVSVAAPTEHSESSREDENVGVVPVTTGVSPSPAVDRSSSDVCVSGVESQIVSSDQDNNNDDVGIRTGDRENEDKAEVSKSDEDQKSYKIYTYISGRRFGNFRNRHSKERKRELSISYAKRDTVSNSKMDQREQPEDRSRQDSPDCVSVKGGSNYEQQVQRQSQMWISVENVNALWNIDGEICESNMLKLEPKCQFFSLFGARPAPVKSQKSKGKDSQTNERNSLIEAEAVVTVDGNVYIQRDKIARAGRRRVRRRQRRRERRARKEAKKQSQVEQKRRKKKKKRRTKNKREGGGSGGSEVAYNSNSVDCRNLGALVSPHEDEEHKENDTYLNVVPYTESIID